MTALLIIVLLVFLPLSYAMGRVHGINQSVRALDKYGAALAIVDGKDPKALLAKTDKKARPKNVHYQCGGQWGKWVDCKVNIVKSDGSPTGNKVLGQRRDCLECGQKEVRTDI